jgi:flagellar hook-length control protein FliK
MSSSAAITPAKSLPASPQRGAAAVRLQGSASFQRELDAADRLQSGSQRREDRATTARKPEPAAKPSSPEPAEPADEQDPVDPAQDDAAAQANDDAAAQVAAESASPRATPSQESQPQPAAQVVAIDAAAQPAPALDGEGEAQGEGESPSAASASVTALASAQGDPASEPTTLPLPGAPAKPGPAHSGGGAAPGVGALPGVESVGPAPAALSRESAQAAAPAPDLPPAPSPDAEMSEQNVARLARGLRAAVQQNGGAVTLRLTPPELGEVRIQMQVHQSHVTASLQVEQDSVNALLSHRLGQLRHALESQGLVVDRLEVQTAAAREPSTDLGRTPDDGRSRGQLAQQQQQQSRSREDRALSGSARRQAFQDALIDSVA